MSLAALRFPIRPPMRAATLLVSALLAALALHRASEDRRGPPPFGGRSMGDAEGIAPQAAAFLLPRSVGSPATAIDAARFTALALWKDGGGLRRTSAQTVWREIGPASIPGRVRAIAFRPDDAGRMYAGTATGGVFVSSDSGATWTAATDDLPSLSIGAIAVDPLHPGTAYAGTGEPIVPLSHAVATPSYTGVGILKTTDGGTSWTALPWPGAPSAISRILVHPAEPDTVLAASRDGVVRSVDGGATWQLNQLGGVISDLRHRPGDPATVYAAVGNDLGDPQNGVWISHAGGARFTWYRAHGDFPPPDSTGRIVLAGTPADPDYLLALCAQTVDKGDDFLAVMRSTDGGENWTRIHTNLPFDFALEQAHYDLCLSISPVDRNLVFAGGLEIWGSADGGTTWGKLTFAGQLVHVDQHVIAFAPGSPAVYFGNDGGIYRTTDRGTSWDARGNGLANAQFYSVAVESGGGTRVFGGTQDNGTLQLVSDADRKWRILRGDGDGGVILAEPTVLYSLITVLPTPYRSFDGGQIWSQMNRGLATREKHNWLQPLALHPHERSTLYTGTQVVYSAEAADDQQNDPTWRAISPDLTATTRLESVITTIATAPTNDNRMYVGSGDGRLHTTDDLLSGTPSWTNVSAGLPARWITRIAVDSSDDRTAVVAFSGYGGGHVFRTTDAGANWIDISGNLPDLPVNAVLIVNPGARAILAGTDLGVWYTTDGGTIWDRYGFGLPNAVVSDLTFNNGGGLLAATFGRGIWSVDLLLGARPAASPAALQIDPAYPNPVSRRRGSVAIHVVVPSGSGARVMVYDLQGRNRLTLPNVETGVLDLPTGSLESGVYFVRLADGNRSRTLRFVVLD